MRIDTKTGLEFEIIGSGEPILFIHGGFIAGTFHSLIREEALSGFQRIRYHRRGYAGSGILEAPMGYEERAHHAASLLQSLDIHAAHIVGHSSGAMTALKLTLDNPDLVRSLTVIEPPLTDVPSEERLFTSIGDAFEQFALGNHDIAVDLFMSAVSDRRWKQAVESHIPGGVEQATLDAPTSFALDKQSEWDFKKEDAIRLSGPVLYIQGSDSHPYFRECGSLMGHWLPHMESATIAGVNHNLLLQAPNKVAERLAEFLVDKTILS